MKAPSQFLLASGSPRRKFLLESLGIPFSVVDNPWNEIPHPGERPLAQVWRLAREKLQAYLETDPAPDLPVLTADTLLAFRGHCLNKPKTEAEAWSFYQRLAGNTHRVLTSFALYDPQIKIIRQKTVSTRVRFVPWNIELYRQYLNRREWVDAAGGYKIQETGCVLVESLHGSWTNVVGLPCAEVYGILLQTLRIPRV